MHIVVSLQRLFVTVESTKLKETEKKEKKKKERKEEEREEETCIVNRRCIMEPQQVRLRLMIKKIHVCSIRENMFAHN